MAQQKRNRQPRQYYAIRFPKGKGAELHPAFEKAQLISSDTMQLDFPIQWPGILKSKQSQRSWASDKAKHLRTWGIEAEIVQLAQPETTLKGI